MLDARPRCADDGELGGDEQRVRHEQEHDDRERNDDLCHHSSSSRGVGSLTTISDSTARSAKRSTSKSYSPIEMRSPNAGRCPSASMTMPPTVEASVSHVVSSAAAAS